MKRLRDLMLLSAVGLSVILGAGCRGAKSTRQFTLPEGDPVKGKAAFAALHCYTCHKVDGINDLPAPSPTVADPVVIGGEVTRVRTYGELLTAIVHPSHNLSQQQHQKWMSGKLSPMPQFNHVMTVEQMIDLVTFLQARYKTLPALYSDYPY